MGQTQSLRRGGRTAAEAQATQGWPAYMTRNDVQTQMHKFRVERSLMGRRVRFFDAGNRCIEYVQLSTGHYQRVDGACGRLASVPKFPDAMAGSELPGGERMPHSVAVRRGNYAEVVDKRTRQCATYRLTTGGVWLKVEERCQVAVHEHKVRRQSAALTNQQENKMHAEVLAGKRPRPRDPVDGAHTNSMSRLLHDCYETDSGSGDDPPCGGITSTRGRRMIPYQRKANARTMTRARINPSHDCAYGDPWYKPQCQALLRTVGADKQATRQWWDKEYGAFGRGGAVDQRQRVMPQLAQRRPAQGATRPARRYKTAPRHAR